MVFEKYLVLVTKDMQLNLLHSKGLQFETNVEWDAESRKHHMLYVACHRCICLSS